MLKFEELPQALRFPELAVALSSKGLQARVCCFNGTPLPLVELTECDVGLAVTEAADGSIWAQGVAEPSMSRLVSVQR